MVKSPFLATPPTIHSQFRTKLRKESHGRRLVVQYHMDLVGDGWRGAVFAAYQRWVLPRVLAAADRVVVSSLDYARHGALAPYIKQLGERLVEIPIGVDVERFKQNAERKTQNAEPFTVLFVGGLDRAHVFKGVPVLLDAVARTVGVQLHVVGDGDLRPVYEQRARELGISDRVEFLGSISDDELPDIYRSADVLVLPSTSRSEAFGVVLLEAMASGIPVITSDLPGVRTVVADGETGFVVSPGNAQSLVQRLQALAGDRSLCRQMGMAARERIEKCYRWNAVMDCWQALYQSVWNNR
jgi:glycosyltransferase involved in cell wall biosynthesis